MHSRVGLVVVVLSALVGCGGGDDAPPARTPTPLDTATTGRIDATVRFTGTVPAMHALDMGGFAECLAQHPTPASSGDVIVGNGAVENAFVYLKEGLGDRVFAIPETPVVIDQKGCLYVPRVVGAQAWQPIEFLNSDPTLHNVHGQPKNSEAWNVALSRKGVERTIRVPTEEVMISVRCDLHPWMQGWIGVLDHPYFGVTGADGSVTLENVPPGDYVIAAWHERFGTREAKVTLAPSGTATTTLTFGDAG
jgi:hypothetical protein